MSDELRADPKTMSWVETGIWCGYEGAYVTSTDALGCGCSIPDPEWPKSEEWMKATHTKAAVFWVEVPE